MPGLFPLRGVFLMRHLADELADVRATLAELKAREDALRQRLIAANDRNGEEWRADVCNHSRERLDIAAAKSALGNKLAPFLTKAEVTTVRLFRINQTDQWGEGWHRRRRENPIPEKVRLAVLERAAGCCEMCARASAGGRIELHHLRYRRGLIFGCETPTDLLAVCRSCHQSCHTGPDDAYYLDPEECAEKWAHSHEQG
jgi:hypothetical protein